MIAIRIKIEVTSNGSRYCVNSNCPTSRAPPPVKDPNVTPAVFGSMLWMTKLRTQIKAANSGIPKNFTIRDLLERCSDPAFSSMMTKTNKTMIAPA